MQHYLLGTDDLLGNNNNNKSDINFNILNNTCCSTGSTCSCTCSLGVSMELDALVSTPMLHDSVVTVDVIGGSAGSNSDIDFNIFNHFCRPRGSPSPAQVWGWARLTQCRLRTASSPQSWSHAWAVPQRSATAVVGMDNFDIFGNSGLLGARHVPGSQAPARATARRPTRRPGAARQAAHATVTFEVLHRDWRCKRPRRPVRQVGCGQRQEAGEFKGRRRRRRASALSAEVLELVANLDQLHLVQLDLQDRQDGRDREKGQPRLPAPARDVLEYFVHDTWMRSQDDEANYQWAGWASLRKLRIGCSWIEINEAVEAYRDAEEEAYNEAK